MYRFGFLLMLALLIAFPVLLRAKASSTCTVEPPSGATVEPSQCVAAGSTLTVRLQHYGNGQPMSVFIVGGNALVSGADRMMRVGLNRTLLIDTRSFFGTPLGNGDYTLFAKDFTGSVGGSARVPFRVGTGGAPVAAASPATATLAVATAAGSGVLPTPTTRSTLLTPTAGSTAPTATVHTTIQPTAAATIATATPTRTGQPTTTSSGIEVSLNCESEPEITRIENNTGSTITIVSIVSLASPGTGEPIQVSRQLGAGGTIQLESGPGASRISRLIERAIYENDDPDEGVRVETSIGTFTQMCQITT